MIGWLPKRSALHLSCQGLDHSSLQPYFYLSFKHSASFIMPLCSKCQQISPWTLKTSNDPQGDVKNFQVHHESFTNLQSSAHHCDLCFLIYLHLCERSLRYLSYISADAPLFLATTPIVEVDLSAREPQFSRMTVRCDLKELLLLTFAKDVSQAAIEGAVAARFPLALDC